MRCNNCGFENPANRTRCEKCNAPLQGSMIGQSTEPGYVAETNGNDLNATIKGSQVNAEPWDCPSCGRPLVPGAGGCNFCGYKLGQAMNEPVKPVEAKEEVNKPKEEVFREKKRNFNATIDPYQKGFKLKPIHTDYENEMQEIPLRVSADEIVLGRETLEPGNNTISSEQAVMVNRSGRWFIKNSSSKDSTFIFANDFIELQDGDVIMMGDRKFRFIK